MGSLPLRIITKPSLALVALLAAADGAELSLSTATVPPASVLLIPVTFASQSASLTGIQFDLQYDPCVLSLTATVGETARPSGKSL